MTRFLDRAVNGRPFRPQVLSSRFTNQQIKSLATGAISVVVPLISVAQYRQYLGGVIWLDTRAGAYTNMAVPAGSPPVNNVVDLYLRFGGNTIFAPFDFGATYQAFSGAGITRFPLIPQRQSLVINGGQAPENIGLPATYTEWPTDLNDPIEVKMDNWTGAYEVDQGALQGGHELNSMIIDLYFVQLPVPTFSV